MLLIFGMKITSLPKMENREYCLEELQTGKNIGKKSIRVVFVRDILRNISKEDVIILMSIVFLFQFRDVKLDLTGSVS